MKEEKKVQSLYSLSPGVYDFAKLPPTKERQDQRFCFSTVKGREVVWKHPEMVTNEKGELVVKPDCNRKLWDDYQLVVKAVGKFEAVKKD